MTNFSLEMVNDFNWLGGWKSFAWEWLMGLLKEREMENRMNLIPLSWKLQFEWVC